MTEPAYPHAEWRLIFDAPNLPGALNMARDEALLRSIARGDAPPTVRFYGWQPACLSLGANQPAAEADDFALRELGYQLVRRPTGGRAILHTDELTYAVVLPLSDLRMSPDIVASYRTLSAGLLRGLQILGAQPRSDPLTDREVLKTMGPVCFDVPSHYEITVNGKKLLGSAQVRKQGVVLQHGALPLHGDIGRICDVLAFAADSERQVARASLYQHACTLADALGRPPDWHTTAQALAAGLAEALNVTFTVAGFTPVELALAEQLLTEKYANRAWTVERAVA